MEKIRYRKNWRFLAIALASVAFIFPANFQAHAQTALNLNNILPNRGLDSVRPNAGEEETAVTSHSRGPAMSEEEAQAFLAKPRNWFHSIGQGGSPFTKPVALDSYAMVLSDEDEKLYRQTFELIEKGKHTEARAVAAQVEDKLLIGHVEAAMLLSTKKPSLAAMQDWLKQYSSLPEADDIYDRALKVKTKGVSLEKPVASRRFSGNVERADGGGTTEWNSEGLSANVPAAKRNELTKLLKSKPKDNEVAQWIAAQTAPKAEAEEGIDAAPKQAASKLDDTADIGARFTAAEYLMRRGHSSKAWALIRDIDPTKGKLSDTALAYALWVKSLVAWIEKSYVTSYTGFNTLAEMKDLPGQNRAAAAFWGARAATKSGRKGEASRLMALAAKQPRSFYGVLAMSHHNATPQYNWNMPTFDSSKAEALKKEPEGRRALALLQLDERVLAEAELRDLSLHQRPDLVNSVLALANRYRLPALAMQVGSAVKRDNNTYDAALYPLIPWQPEGGYASDPALVLAVAKNESHFNHAARSHVGAGGLMQVMPKTAEYVKAGSSRNLYDPEVNVTLGDRYLDLLTRTEGVKDNLLLIIGSYNGGPDTLVKLREAISKQNGDDALLFIETLPIKETRNYMQKVLATYWVYRARFNRPLKAMAELAIGRWPQYRPNDMKLTNAAPSY
jgi:soluble lytic murein transglycosylase